MKIKVAELVCLNTPRIETERLILRKFTDKDIKALFLILKDEDVNRFLPWYPVKDLEETKRFYEERYVSKYLQPQGYAYAVCFKENNVTKERENKLWIGVNKRLVTTRKASTAARAFWRLFRM